MNHQGMRERCSESRFVKRVYLRGYRLVYDGDGRGQEEIVANIVATGCAKDIVWGGLYEISDRDLERLDDYEEYPSSYQRKEIEVEDEEGNAFRALCYLREGRKEEKPSWEYREVVIEGARDCGLPEDYIEDVLRK